MTEADISLWDALEAPNFEPNCEVYFKPIDERGRYALASGVKPRNLKVKIITEDGTEYTGRVER